LLAQVYVELTGGRQIGLGLADAGSAPEAPDPATANVLWHRPAGTGPQHEPRPHCASPEELERHRIFIAGIAGAIWTR